MIEQRVVDGTFTRQGLAFDFDGAEADAEGGYSTVPAINRAGWMLTTAFQRRDRDYVVGVFTRIEAGERGGEFSSEG